MSNYIDRNADKMIQYGKGAVTVLDETGLIIRKIQGILEASKPNLDTPSIERIEELKSCCNQYFQEMDSYRSIASTVLRKGQRLKDIRGE